jgi:hypothetical protein
MAVQASTAGSFRDLPRLQRNAVRTVARNSWLRCGGRANQAILDALPDLPQHVGKDYLPTAESLAAQLIRYWAANRVFEPEAIGVDPEPGWGVDE